MRSIPPLRYQSRCVACARAIAPACAPANDIGLTPQRISTHGWFFQGEAGMASAQNKGFMSNAGFVVTTTASSSSTRSAHLRWDAR
jgi:hypothetical protein